MTDKTKAALAMLWLIFILALSAMACGSSTESLCPDACHGVGLTYTSSTATTCYCMNGDEVIKLW